MQMKTHLTFLFTLLVGLFACSGEGDVDGTLNLQGNIIFQSVSSSVTLTLGVIENNGTYKHGEKTISSAGNYTFTGLQSGKSYILFMEATGDVSCVLTRNVFANITSDITDADINCKAIPSTTVTCNDTYKVYTFENEGKIKVNLSDCESYTDSDSVYHTVDFIYTNTSKEFRFSQGIQKTSSILPTIYSSSIPTTPTKNVSSSSMNLQSNSTMTKLATFSSADIFADKKLNKSSVKKNSVQNKNIVVNTFGNEPPNFVREFDKTIPQILKKGKQNEWLMTNSVDTGSLNRSMQPQLSLQNVNSTTRQWYSTNSTSNGKVQTTLRAQGQLYDGKILKVWVENDLWENNTNEKVDANKLLPLFQKFCGAGTSALYGSGGTGTAIDCQGNSNGNIYKKVIDIVGEPWGTHSYNNLIPSSKNEMHIVLYAPPSQGTGTLMGFFFSANNLKKSAIAYSNEELVFFMNGKVFGKGDSSSTWGITHAMPQKIVSTLAHEFQHMIHFYQKAIVRGVQTPVWINEMLSMLVEDMLSIFVSGTVGVGPGFDQTVGSTLYPSRLSQYKVNTSCTLSNWYSTAVGDCNVLNSYATAYSFGAFMARHHGGKTFIKKITESSKNNFAVINEAAGETSADGYKKWMARWSASVAMLKQFDRTKKVWPSNNIISTNYTFKQQGSSCSTATDEPCLQKLNVADKNRTIKPFFKMDSKNTDGTYERYRAKLLNPQSSISGYMENSTYEGYVTIPADTILTVVVNAKKK